MLADRCVVSSMVLVDTHILSAEAAAIKRRTGISMLSGGGLRALICISAMEHTNLTCSSCAATNAMMAKSTFETNIELIYSTNYSTLKLPNASVEGLLVLNGRKQFNS
jgi:hypothetical protein